MSEASDNDRDFMTHEEMRALFPDRTYRSLELVALWDHHGEGMWARDPDGWRRLEDKLHGS